MAQVYPPPASVSSVPNPGLAITLAQGRTGLWAPLTSKRYSLPCATKWPELAMGADQSGASTPTASNWERLRASAEAACASIHSCKW